MRLKLLHAFALAVYCGTVSAELLDPRELDATISDTDVSVSITRTEEGFYKYSYELIAGESNEGEISIFGVNLACDQEFQDYALPEPELGQFGTGVANPGEPPLFTPSVVGSDPANIFFGISISRDALWGVSLEPGSSIKGMYIISPFEPGMREYVFEPAIDTGSYDYDSLPDDVTLDDIPQPWDFDVTGLVAGPACPGVTPTPESPRFKGASSGVAQAPEALNTLLTYSEPLQDRFMVPADQDSLTLTIHYDERLDPESFRVEPGHLQSLFAPVPGTSETVAMPLAGAINEFLLEAQGSNSGLRDKDLFEVRLRHAADDASSE